MALIFEMFIIFVSIFRLQELYWKIQQTRPRSILSMLMSLTKTSFWRYSFTLFVTSYLKDHMMLMMYNSRTILCSIYQYKFLSSSIFFLYVCFTRVCWLSHRSGKLCILCRKSWTALQGTIQIASRFIMCLIRSIFFFWLTSWNSIYFYPANCKHFCFLSEAVWMMISWE